MVISFKTKTIQKILLPLSDRIDHLVTLYAEAQDGAAIEPVSPLISQVKIAVANLQSVGKETANDCNDQELQTEMHRGLKQIEEACQKLDQCDRMISADNSSKEGRDFLIAGSRLILIGTAKVLESYDDYQVRQLVVHCNKIKDFLKNSTLIRIPAENEAFSTNLRPGLQMTDKKILDRVDEIISNKMAILLKDTLTEFDQAVEDILSVLSLLIEIPVSEQPASIKANKIKNQVKLHLADSNRHIDLIIEILLCASSLQAENELFAKTQENLFGENKSHPATLNQNLDKIRKFLSKPDEDKNQVGETAVRDFIETANDLIKNKDPEFTDQIRDDIQHADDNLACVLSSVEANDKENMRAFAGELGRNIYDVRDNLENLVMTDIVDLFTYPDRPLKELINAVKNPIDDPTNQQQKSLKKQDVQEKLQNFQNHSEKLGQAADEMLKISVISDPNHRQIFENAAKKLKNAQEKIAFFADLAKDDYDFDNSQVHKKFDENCQEWQREAIDLAKLVDEVTDPYKFLEQCEANLEINNANCKKFVAEMEPQKCIKPVVANTKICERILAKTKMEAEHINDVALVDELEKGFEELKDNLPQVVIAAKTFSSDQQKESGDALVEKNSETLDCVRNIKRIFQEGSISNVNASMMVDDLAGNPYRPDDTILSNEDDAFDSELDPSFLQNQNNNNNNDGKPRETRIESINILDDEEANQEIHLEAKNLLDQVKENDKARAVAVKNELNLASSDLAAVAKRMAVLMAKMASLVNGLDKTELIACAKQIAKESSQIIVLGNKICDECKDKRLAFGLKRYLDGIPTFSTQLKILSTIKATTMGQDLSEEEIHAGMETLVVNAQNLMGSVLGVVQSADAATIFIESKKKGPSNKWRKFSGR